MLHDLKDLIQKMIKNLSSLDSCQVAKCRNGEGETERTWRGRLKLCLHNYVMTHISSALAALNLQHIGVCVLRDGVAEKGCRFSANSPCHVFCVPTMSGTLFYVLNYKRIIRVLQLSVGRLSLTNECAFLLFFSSCRTESVAEKMLTNWFAFLLHKFLKVKWRLFSWRLIAPGVGAIDDNAS